MVFSQHMVSEFSRYGLAKFRVLVGSLELAGAAGLGFGFFFEEILVVASAGLSALMFLGVLTRIRIGDSVVLALPAFVLMCTNIAILLSTLGTWSIS